MKSAKPLTSKFMLVRCSKCNNEQVTFSKASSEVICLICNKVISSPVGGIAKVHAEVVEEFKA